MQTIKVTRKGVILREEYHKKDVFLLFSLRRIIGTVEDYKAKKCCPVDLLRFSIARGSTRKRTLGFETRCQWTTSGVAVTGTQGGASNARA
jgi:hypothetical protein